MGFEVTGNIEEPPADFIGAVHDATGLTGPEVEAAAFELWNIAVKPRLAPKGKNVDLYGPKKPLPDGDLLTQREATLLTQISDVVKGFTEIYEADVERGDSRPSTHSNDMAEVVTHIHDLQARVLSRAAARAYPGLYRLL